MPSPRPNAVMIAEYNPSARQELTTSHNLAPIAPAGDTAMYKLSKRLWSIEVHRRLEIQTRRVLDA